MKALTRRDLLACAAMVGGGALAGATANLLAAGQSQGGGPPASAAGKGAYSGQYTVEPLPFEASKLKGLSERLITSHWEKNYGGAVKRLNDVQQRLGALAGDAPPYLIGALKREELRAMNSMLLHELYFGNLGGDGRAFGRVLDWLKASYGTKEIWEADFRKTAMSLAGGSGWVVLTYLPRDKQLLNIWSADHLVNVASGTALLVLDMYEHSYQMDYGADAQKYIDAFFQNIDWQAVDTRALSLS